jgi:hypothetical protein
MNLSPQLTCRPRLAGFRNRFLAPIEQRIGLGWRKGGNLAMMLE